MCYNSLTLETSIKLKGLLCIFVLFHHINQRILLFDNTVIGLLLNQLGYLSVAVFLFLSGYGIYIQSKKKAILNDYLKIKIFSSYIIYIIIAVIYFLLIALIKGNPSTTTIIRTFFFGGTVVANGWYFQCQLAMYITFFFAFSFSKKQKVNVLSLFLLGTLYFVLCLFMKLDAMWYQAVPCFLFGVLYAMYENNFKKITTFKSLIILVIVFGVSFVASKAISFVSISTFFKIVSALAFSCSVVNLVLLKPSFIPAVFRHIGVYSLEVYAFHGAALMLLRGKILYVQNDFLFIILVLLLTAVFSVTLHPLFSSITKRLKNISVKC